MQTHSSHTSSLVDTCGTYIFAVASAQTFTGGPVEDLDGPLDLVDRADLIAITSPIDLSEQGATDEMARRHEQMLEVLMEGTDHVPLEPGMALGSHQGVRTFLADYHRTLRAEMQRLGSATERTLRLSWAIEDRGALLADKYDELAELRRAADGASSSEFARIARQFSQRLDEALETERRNYREVLERRIVPECREVRRIETGGDEELMRLDCLIERDARETFTTKLYELADDLGEATVFDVTDPAPPLSFLDEQLIF